MIESYVSDSIAYKAEGGGPANGPVMLLLWMFGIAHSLYQCHYKEAGRVQHSDNLLDCLHLAAACLPVATPGDEVLTVPIQDVVALLSHLALGSQHDLVWGVWPAKAIFRESVSVYGSHENKKKRK